MTVNANLAATQEAPVGEKIDFSRTIISFMATGKYPPSLAYLCMTLGPAILLLVAFERFAATTLLVRVTTVFGSVPMFFYIVHFYLIHLGAILTYWAVCGEALSPFQEIYASAYGEELSPNFGFGTLWQVYLAWLLVVAILFYPCRWYGTFKRTSKNPVWSYL